MSHERQPNGDLWTLGALKEYLESRLNNQDKAVAAAFAASEKAIIKAESRLDDTLVGFPQEYARNVELAGLRKELEVVRNIQSKQLGALIFLAFGLPVVVSLLVHFVH